MGELRYPEVATDVPRCVIGAKPAEARSAGESSRNSGPVPLTGNSI